MKQPLGARCIVHEEPDLQIRNRQAPQDLAAKEYVSLAQALKFER